MSHNFAMREKSLDAILGSFDLGEIVDRPDLRARGGTVTVWLSPDYKAKYNHLQTVSQGRFSKTLREIVKAAIDRAEAQAAS
jgi:hypothetical protein